MDQNTLEDIRIKLSSARLGKPVLIGIVAVLIMVAVLAGIHINDTATASQFRIDQAASSQKAASASAASSDAASGLASSDEAPQTIFVHVSGAVVEPGLYEVESGARLAQAIQLAGGFAEGADTGSVNLARVLSDGEQVVVLEAQAQQASPAPNEQQSSSTSPSQPASQQTATAAGKVNLNTATQSDLETLPGIGPSTAQKIVADRTANGPFASVDDLARVSGIGTKKLEALRDLVCT